MNLKHLPDLLFELELAKARLKVAAVGAMIAESEIYEVVCQNLVFVHYKLSALRNADERQFNTSHIHVNNAYREPAMEQLSEMILQSVRELRKLPGRVYPNIATESISELLRLLNAANKVLGWGIKKIEADPGSVELRTENFVLLFSGLYDLIAAIVASKRSVGIVSIKVMEEGFECSLGYSGLPVNIGRLRTVGLMPELTRKASRRCGEFSSLRKTIFRKSISGRNTINLFVPFVSGVK